MEMEQMVLAVLRSLRECSLHRKCMILEQRFFSNDSEWGQYLIDEVLLSQQVNEDKCMIVSISGWDKGNHDSNEHLSGDEEKSHELLWRVLLQEIRLILRVLILEKWIFLDLRK